MKSDKMVLYPNYKKIYLFIQFIYLQEKYICQKYSFLTNRKQRVTLNGQPSSWTNSKAGVPHVFIIEPSLFLIYINNLANDLSSNIY